jgi:THO complex subunit 5
MTYSHQYQQLPLIPVEEFLSQHPEHTDADETTLILARIEHEYNERKALEEQRMGLLKKKQSLIADNKKRKDDLANLDKDLEKFIDVSCAISSLTKTNDGIKAAKPIQKMFEKVI